MMNKVLQYGERFIFMSLCLSQAYEQQLDDIVKLASHTLDNYVG